MDDLPKDLEWLAQLSPMHYRLCLVELKDAVGAAFLTDDWTRLAELLEDWEATAAIDASPKLSARLMAETEYQEISKS